MINEVKSGLLRKKCRIITGHDLAAVFLYKAQKVTESATENIPLGFRFRKLSKGEKVV